MTGKEYLDKAKFPNTTQGNLTLSKQMMIDAVNHDALRGFIDEGGKMSPKQEAIWKELEEKAQHRTELAKELAL